MERLQAKKQFTVKNVVFGGEKFLGCIPVCSESREAFLEALKLIMPHHPDVIEWRIDYFERLDDPAYAAETMKMAAEIIGDTPLLLTFRHLDEGGAKFYPDDIRKNIIEAVIDTGLVDLADIELTSETGFLNEIKEYTKSHGVKFILSWHSMEFTPSVEEMMDRLEDEQKLGADVAKISVRPNSPADVLKLLTAAYRSRTERVDIPQITVSKDDLCSKIVGSCLGSDLAFLGVPEVNGITQLDLEDCRGFYELCYGKKGQS